MSNSKFGLRFLLKHGYHSVDLRELVLPGSIIQELSQIKSVVVSSIVLTVVTRRQHSALMSVNRVKSEEFLHFVTDLTW